MLISSVLCVVMFLAALAVGDATGAAVIAGFFTVVNTAMLAVLHRRQGDLQRNQEDVKTALTAPRRLIYDQDGNPIGTVLDLHRTGGWDEWLTARHGRRQTDDPPPPAAAAP